MANQHYTLIRNFSFIVKQPSQAKCTVVTKDLLMTHESDSYEYADVLKSYFGSLFVSSSDPDFDSVMNLYNSPVSFDCISVESVEVNPYDLEWLSEEILNEFSNNYPDDEFYSVLFL